MNKARQSADGPTSVRRSDSNVVDPTTAHLMAIGDIDGATYPAATEHEKMRSRLDTSRHDIAEISYAQAREREACATELRLLLPEATDAQIIDYTNKYFGWHTRSQDKQIDYFPGYRLLAARGEDERETASSLEGESLFLVGQRFAELKRKYELLVRMRSAGSATDVLGVGPIAAANDATINEYAKVIREFESAADNSTTTIGKLRTLCGLLYELHGEIYQSQIDQQFTDAEQNVFRKVYIVLNSPSAQSAHK